MHFISRQTYFDVETSLEKHACQKSHLNFAQLLKHRQKTISFINNGSVTCISLKTLKGYFYVPCTSSAIYFLDHVEVGKYNSKN